MTAPADAPSSPRAAPQLADYFVRGTALGLIARRHPYDFIETYDVLQRAYGYRSRYVNLGLWRPSLVEDGDALDPGERLVRFLCARSGVRGARRVLDAGSGLGQGAIDLLRWLDAARVDGVNVNERQIAFANALARTGSVEDRVVHARADACSELPGRFGDDAFDAVFAVECVGHFQRPQQFLADVRRILQPGGVFVCCLNVATGPLPIGMRAMLKTTYGFVPRPRAFWTDALADAGLTVTDEGDLTDAVLQDGAAAVLARLQEDEVRRALPGLTVALVERQLRLVIDAVARGRLGYTWIVARR